MRKISALEQQRFAACFCQCVGKAISEVQLCWVSTSSTEIAVGLACNASLGFRHWFDDQLRFPEIIETPAGDRITCRVDDRGSFYKIGSRKSPVLARSIVLA